MLIAELEVILFSGEMTVKGSSAKSGSSNEYTDTVDLSGFCISEKSLVKESLVSRLILLSRN